ncbi:MAG: CPBP family intramembrane metalloprotease [Prevotellaceae bacterium]|jgi:membrane protease YdiL (CAAX protease family)|nr:CPBP family intramembrane metalloprotease [Prevotellaceae bacterium]
MNFLERAFDNQNQWWKYPLCILGGILIGNIVGGLFIILAILLKTTISPISDGGEISDIISDLNTFLNAGTPFSLFLLISIFAFSLLFSVIFIKSAHNRRFSELINGTSTIRWSHFSWGAFIWFTLSLIYLLIDFYMHPTQFTIRFEFSTFIRLVVVALICVPFQTTYEEYIFRGYLAQGIGIYTKSRWMSIIIPGILFGLMHVTNPEVQQFGFWVMMPHYIGFGLIVGLIAILDDGIELSMGIHAANNIFSAIFVTTDQSVLQTDALFRQLRFDPVKELAAFILISTVAIIFFSIKYNWRFSLLNKRISPEDRP